MRNDGMADGSTYSTIVGIANEVSELESENAALRTQLADVTESMGRVEERCAKLRALCRDMYLVVELLDMDGMKLQAHGKDADWRTLKERFDELYDSV
jgi:hypothetical protein